MSAMMVEVIVMVDDGVKLKASIHSLLPVSLNVELDLHVLFSHLADPAITTIITFTV